MKRSKNKGNQIGRMLLTGSGIWRRTVSVLACVVIFVTTYAMILPAVTLEKDHTNTVGMVVDEEIPTDASASAESLTAVSVSDTGDMDFDRPEDEVIASSDFSGGDETHDENTQEYPEIEKSGIENPLIYDTEAYTAYAYFTSVSDLPADTGFTLTQINETDSLKYQNAAETKLEQHSDRTAEITGSRFYKVLFANGSGAVIPASSVDIKIEFKNDVESHSGEAAFAVSFSSENDADATVFADKNADGSDAVRITDGWITELDLKDCTFSGECGVAGFMTVKNANPDTTEVSAEESAKPESETEADEAPMDEVFLETGSEEISGDIYTELTGEVSEQEDSELSDEISKEADRERPEEKLETELMDEASDETETENTDEGSDEAAAEQTEEASEEAVAEQTDEISEETSAEQSDETSEETAAEQTDETTEETVAEQTEETSEEIVAEQTAETSEETVAEQTEETSEETVAEQTDETSEETVAEQTEETSEETVAEQTEETSEEEEILDEVSAETDSELTDESSESSEESAQVEQDGEVVYEAGELQYEGHDYTVILTFTEDAQIPADASVSVRELLPDTEEYAQYLIAAKQAMGLDDSAVLPAEQARFFDITILEADGVTEREPKAPVTVQIIYDEPVNVPDTDQMNALHFPEGETVPEILEVQDIQTEEADESAVTGVTFDSDSFSVFGVVYTVDFYYGEYEYHLTGEGEMLLSELFDALQIDANAADASEVTFTDPELLQIEQIADDWKLISLQPFDTEEILTVLMENGDEYVIRVTDAQENVGYIVDFKVSNTITGTAPFDEKEENENGSEKNVRGNDTSSSDDRVRSYDSIIYQVDAQAQSHTANTKEYGNLVYTFIIPDDPELELNLNSMGWAEQVGDVDRTTRSGYKIYTVRSKDPVEMPGHHYPQFSLKVGNKTEGYEIHPEIQVKVEGNNIVKVAENVPITTVTSKPAYNVQLDLVNRLSSINEYTIDGKAIKGMLASYAFAVQMRNTEPNKGLKGIELPKAGELITFDIDLSSSYRKDGTSEPIDLKNLYKVLLKGAEENGATTNADHQLPASSHNNVINAGSNGIVYQNGNVTIEQIIGSDGSNKLHVTINNSAVTDISQFPTTDADGVERFRNSDGSLLIGNISTYRFDLVQVTEWTDEGNNVHNIQTDTVIGDNSANGTVQVTAEVSNLSMKSCTDAEIGTGEGKFAESVTTDNLQVTNRQLYGGNAKYDHEIFFSSHEVSNNNEGSLVNNGVNSGTDSQNKSDGSDSAVMGNEIWFTAYYDQTEINAGNERARTIAFDQLIKFDNAVLKPSENQYSSSGANTADGAVWRNNNLDWETLDILYVGKVGGWYHQGLKPWEAGYDQDMIKAKEEDEDLHYYTSLSDLPSDEECVGLLLKWRGCSVITEHNNMHIANQIKLQIKDLSENPNLFERDVNENVISSYMITMSTNAWTVDDLMRQYPDDPNYNNWSTWITNKNYGDIARFAMNRDPDHNNNVNGQANQHYFELSNTPHSVDVDRDNNYVKCRYGASGYIGEGTAGWLHGDTLYIVPYKTTVTKKVAQTEGQDSKNAFSLDSKQRYVDFEITGKMQFTQSVNVGDGGEEGTGQDNTGAYDWRTTVTLTDTMSDGLTYLPGSAYLDGVYTERTPNAGTVTGGMPIEPVQNGQTLTFTIPNVSVAEGKIPVIHYSCRIGNTDYPEQDVKNGDQLSNTVNVQTNEDKRVISAKNGNTATAGFTVTKTDKYNIEKYGTESIELDGTGVFHLVVNNDSPNPQKGKDSKGLYAVDFLPQKSDQLKGNYKLKSLKMLTDPLRKPENEGGFYTDDIQFYYALNENQLYQDNYTVVASHANEISLNRIKDNWYHATFDPNTGTITIPKAGEPNGTDWPLAIAYVDQELPARRTAHIELEYEGDCGHVSDQLVNNFSEAELYAQAKADVYSRILSGVVWFDANKDGKIDSDEEKLNDVTVTLYALDSYGRPNYAEKIMETKTLSDGTYSFGVPETIPAEWTEQKIKHHILRAGDYAIVFSGTKVEKYQDVTVKEQAGVGNSVNSKADSRFTGDQLTGAVIQKVHLMSIAEMKSDTSTSQKHRQIVEYQNAGFILNTVAPVKMWKNADNSVLNWPDGQTITLTLQRTVRRDDVEEKDADFDDKKYSLSVGAGSTSQGTVVIGQYTVKAVVEEITEGTNSGAYSIMISGLPMKNGLGESYTYYVTETPVAGYNSIYPQGRMRVGDGEVLINLAGYELPATGGIGTRLLYVIGTVLLLLALILLITKIRVDRQERRQKMSTYYN